MKDLLVCVFCTSLLCINAAAGELKHPDWHPDGQRLAAEGHCHGESALYEIDLVDGNVSLLFDSDAIDGYPRWFHDGTRIAFHQIDEDRRSRIAIAELAVDGTVSRIEVVSGGPFDIEPAPSPDGRYIAYSASGESGQDISILTLASGETHTWRTPVAENFPSWEPAGDAIVFHATEEGRARIFRRAIDSETSPKPVSIEGDARLGHVSHDGTRMVFSSERTGDREIYLVDLETGKETRLTDRPGRDGYPKFSPGGESVAFHSVIGAADGKPETAVSVVDLAGSEVRQFGCPATAGPSTALLHRRGARDLSPRRRQ